MLSYICAYIYIRFQGGSNIRPRPICFELEQYGQDCTSIVRDYSVQGGDKKHGFSENETLLLPIGQDILNDVSHVKQLPPIHILLRLVVKSLNGNVELLQVLNHLGHSMSYSVTQPIDTALCVQKTESVGNFEIPLMHKIHPNVFTTLVWDKIDHTEETLTGGESLHHENGRATQSKFISPQFLR